MNNVQYKIDSFIYNIKNQENFDVDKYVSDCYDKFIEKTKGWPMSVTKEELEDIIRQIYDVLKLILDKETTINCIDSYLHFLGLTVTVSQIDIDKFCCIEKLLYLKWNNHIRENKGIDESIIFIKDRLNNIYKANKKDKTKVKTIRFFSSSYEQ